MATTFRMHRRPRTRKYSKDIGDELRRAYEKELFPAVEQKYGELANFDSWAKEPKFRFVVKINSKRILVECKLDMRFNASKAFWYQDKGTGLDGPTHNYYVIQAQNAQFLEFVVPTVPITYPEYTSLRYDPWEPPKWIKTKTVIHPGIQKRDFSVTVVDWVKDKSNPRGLWNTTEKAYKRVFNRTKNK